MPKSLFMGSTGVAAARSASKVVAELVNGGASSISTNYDNGRIIGIRWVMKVNGQDIWFDMPARVDPVFQRIRMERKRPTDSTDAVDLATAERVAWRQLLRWVQAQNAMIQSRLSDPGEVYMAFAVAPGTGRTMFQTWTAQLALPAAGGK